MKNTNKVTILCFSLLAMQATQTSSLWESAKNKAKSGYQSAKQGWQNLDESTKNAIIGTTGIAAAGTIAAGAAGYAGYKAFSSNKNDEPAVRASLTEEEFRELHPNWEDLTSEQKLQGTKFESKT